MSDQHLQKRSTMQPEPKFNEWNSAWNSIFSNHFWNSPAKHERQQWHSHNGSTNAATSFECRPCNDDLSPKAHVDMHWPSRANPIKLINQIEVKIYDRFRSEVCISFCSWSIVSRTLAFFRSAGKMEINFQLEMSGTTLRVLWLMTMGERAVKSHKQSCATRSRSSRRTERKKNRFGLIGMARLTIWGHWIWLHTRSYDRFTSHFTWARSIPPKNSISLNFKWFWHSFRIISFARA